MELSVADARLDLSTTWRDLRVPTANCASHLAAYVNPDPDMQRNPRTRRRTCRMISFSRRP